MTETILATLVNKSNLELVDIIKLVVDKYGEECLNHIITSQNECKIKDIEKESTTGDNRTSSSSKPNETTTTTKMNNKSKKNREFDFSKYRQRHIAFQLQYEGGPYLGFASQNGLDIDNTVEGHFFEALMKLKLIDSRQTCGYSRCGRTDKGVSSLGQIVSLKVRSAIPLVISTSINRIILDGQMQTKDIAKPLDKNNNNKRKYDSDKDDENDNNVIEISKNVELDYCGLLNRALPQSIRVLGWTEVALDFSSRFSTSYRQYRYFFRKKKYDIEAMNVAASYLIGSHDFRNLCKIDIANVSNFIREVYSAKLIPFISNNHFPEEAIFMLEIKGGAFLWHMIRCIMAVLFFVGNGQENPDIIKSLLDVKQLYTSKPHYNLAGELPLVLNECGYQTLHMIRSPKLLWSLTEHFETILDIHSIAAARALNALNFVKNSLVRHDDVKTFIDELLSKTDASAKKQADDNDFLLGKQLSQAPWSDVLGILDKKYNITWEKYVQGKYIPLMNRKRDKAYQEKVETLGGHRKERLERHLDLQVTQKFGSTFFDDMKSKGSI